MEYLHAHAAIAGFLLGVFLAAPFGFLCAAIMSGNDIDNRKHIR